MPIPSAATTPLTNMQTSGSFALGIQGPRCITQRVNLTHGAGHVPLAQNLPPNCMVKWAYVISQAAVVVETSAGDGTNTADGFALTYWPTTATGPLTVPTTGTVSSSTNIIQLSTTTASNSIKRGRTVPLASNAIVQNTATVGALLTIMPSKNSSNRLSYVTSGTAGFFFGTSTATSTNTAGQIDVVLYVEEYNDTPVMT